ERFVKLPAEEVADRRELSGCLRRTNLPLTLEVVLWLLRSELRDADQPYFRVLGGLGFQITVVALAELPLHVRLTRTNPDLSHQHVVDGQLILAGDRQCVRSADRQRIKRDLPLAFSIGLRRLPLSADRHDHVLARISP